VSPGPLLVLDSCGALHLKQLTKPAHPALELLDALMAKLGVSFVCTPAVYGEQVKITLREKLADWERAEQHQRLPVRAADVHKLKTELRKDLPGDNDLGLLALARTHDAALYTHDRKAATASQRLKIPTLDVIDLAGLLVERADEGWPQQERRLGNLHHADWRTSILDWRGSVEATLRSRARWPALLAQIDDRWRLPR
jgi:predicted nucleic acid-binding protein